MSCCLPKVKAFPDGIHLLSLQDLKAFNKFPTHTLAKSKLTNLNKINLQDSFVVFISHAWLQDTAPDNEKSEKFALTIEGIFKLKNEMAPGLLQCYVWLDYSCLKGTEKKTPTFSSLFYDIMLYSDCVFTPIVDHLADHWQLEYTALGYFHDYKASSWNGGKDSHDKKCYLNRAWCRTEAFYCSNVPLYNANQQPTLDDKIAKYAGCLQRLAQLGHRPHFLYGHKEQASHQAPIHLAQLQNTFFADYHPMKGQLSDEDDNDVIQMLVEDLEQKFAQDFEMGYVGDYDADGHQNGLGRYLSAKYDVYRGFFVANRRQHRGVLYAPNGDRYEGNWDNNQKSGEGVMHYISGNVYTGLWAADHFEGKGVIIYTHGPHTQYEGSWEAGKRSGHGKCCYRQGQGVTIEEIEGNWSKNHTKGKAQIKYTDGSVYDGETKDAERHGKGQYTSSIGKYKGDFKHDEYSGRGHMDYADGAVFNGEWRGGVFEGRGSLIREGDEYDGHFKQGLKCGQGRMVYADATSYVGEWLNDQRHGAGKLISADQSVVKEATWEADQIVEKH